MNDKGVTMLEKSQNSDLPLIVEAAGIDYIKTQDRHGKPRNQFAIRFSPVIYLAPILLGGVGIPLGLGLTGTITAIMIANLLGSLAAAACAGMGPRRGMPQLAMSRSSFGYYGNYVPAVLASLLFVGYFSVGTVVGAKSLAGLLAAPYEPLAVAVGLASVVLAVFGHNLLHLTGRWVTAIGITLLAMVTIFALAHGVGPASAPRLSGGQFWLAWLLQFGIVFSFTSSWALYAADYSRYLPADTPFRKVFGYAFAGLFLGSSWMMGLGALLATVLPGNGPLDGLRAVLPHGLLILVLASLAITSITHNAVNLYSCSMASLTWNIPLRQSASVVLAGTIGTITAVALGGSQFQSHFNAFLIVMSYFITPWLAIRLIDFFWKSRRTHTPAIDFYRKDGPFGRVRWFGLGAFTLGIIASSPLMASDLYTGPLARAMNGADVSYLISFLVAGTVYSFSRRPPSPTSKAGREAT